MLPIFDQFFERFPYEDCVVSCDVETTGLANTDRITEIGAAKLTFNGHTIKIEQFKTFVNPERPIPQNIIELTGITNEMVKDAPKDVLAYGNFLAFLDGATTVLAHNADYDNRMLIHNYKRVGLEFNFDIKCSMKKAKQIKSIRPTSYKLTDLANLFGYQNPNAHRAYDDAFAALVLWANLSILE